MSGSGHRRTTKWDMEEGSRHYPGDPIGPGPERPSNRESQPRWHSRERNYKVAREPLDDTMAWDGDSRMSPGLDDWRQQKRKYSFESSRERSHRSRRRSKSPGHRLERPSLNDRVGRVASFDHRNHEPRRSGTMPCKFFASGNCRNGKACRFSHSDQTRDSSNNHERDDYRQSMDSRVNMAPLREGSKWSGSSSDLNVPKRYGNRNEGLGEQRAMRNSVDGSSPRDNRFMAHRMDIDEATRNNRSDDYRLISQSSSGMGASESRGAAIHGVDINGSANSVDGSAPRDNRFMAHRIDIDEATRNNRSDDFRLTTNNSSGMDASELRGTAIHGVDIDGSANSVDGSAPRDNRFMAHRMDITDATRNNRSDDFRLTNNSSGMGASESRGTAIHGVDIEGSANSVDRGAPRDNKFMAHRIDIDEATTDNRSDDFRLTTSNNSGMGASESRGTAIHGVDIEGSATYTGDQLPTLIGTSRKPDVLDTVKSEETSSNQCLMSTDQFSDLTCSLARLLEDGKQLPELYAALNASNALGFMQSSVAVSAGPDVVPASSSRQYDPVNDSMELIKSVISEQPDKIALPSQLPLTGEPSGDGLYETHCKDVELNINSHLSSEKHQFADCENEEHGMVKAEETKEGQDGSKLSDNEGDDKADEKKKNIDGKSLRAFKFALAEFVKELLKPTWKAGQIDKEVHKTIVKKVVNKVTSSVQGVCIPQTQEKIDNYLTAYKPKLSKLVQAYVEKVQKENPKVA